MNNSTHLKECLGDLFDMKRTYVIVKYTPFDVELVINHLTHVTFFGMVTNAAHNSYPHQLIHFYVSPVTPLME